MNIRLKSLAFACAIVASSFVVAYGYWGAQVAAKDSTLSDTEREAVRSGCASLKRTLSQLNYSDTALRINQGQYYEEISTKLMGPMNSRIALNHYDGSKLVSITADYAKKIDVFRADYTRYASALDSAQHSDCTNHPQQFYDNIVTAREARNELHSTVEQLNDMVNDYADHFTDFAKKLPVQDNQDGPNE